MIPTGLFSTVLLVALAGGLAPPDRQSDPNLLERLRIHLEHHYPGAEQSEFLFVSVKRQRMYRVRDGVFVRSYRISTSVNGTGNRINSEKTPLGLHEICEKHGHGVPLGGVFKARAFTGRIAEIQTEPVDLPGDEVTTRVLRLCGMEPGLNQGGSVDSYRRAIYIHGTPEEGLLGRPASDGCVRMSNRAVEELFGSVEAEMKVLILDI